MFDRWVHGVIRLRHVVCAIWVIAAALGLWSESSLSGLLTTPLSVPGTDSARAGQVLLRHFGESIEGSFTVVVPVAHADAKELARDKVLVAKAARLVPTGRVIEQQAALGLLFANVDTSLDLSHAAAQTTTLRHALKAVGVHGALVTGPPALQHDLAPVLSSDLRHGELLAVVLALVLLIVALGLCWAVAVPLLVAGATIGVDLGVVFVLAHLFSMVLYVPNVVALIALGLAVDYSLLIVHRFRRELVEPSVDVEEVIVTTMRTAGRTVVTSSGIVAVGLAILVFVPVPFLRSLGGAGLVVPIVAMAAALTLQPALLAMLGRRGTEPVLALRALGATGIERRWERLGRAVTSRPGPALVSGLALMAICGVSAFWLQLTPGSTSAIPQGLPSARALTLLSDRVGPGAISPSQLVIDLGHAHLATTPRVQAATTALARRILTDPEVFAVGIGDTPPFVDPTGRYEQILVFGRHQLGAEASQRLVRTLRDVYAHDARIVPGARIYVGGAPAQGVDFLAAVYGALPWIVLAALAITLVLLARAFRSLALAIVSVLLNLLSVGSAIGLVVLCTRFGVGATLFGTYRVSQIEGWVPVFLFAVLFGLSMDYEVFLVSRMREAHDAGASTREAIVVGVGRTGRVVSVAAVIFAGAVLGLVFGHVAGLQELGIGLGLGVLLDATVVRCLILPSVMALLDDASWWYPAWAARLLRQTAPPLAHRGAGPSSTAEVSASPDAVRRR